MIINSYLLQGGLGRYNYGVHKVHTIQPKIAFKIQMSFELSRLHQINHVAFAAATRGWPN